ncbi:MAG TPA: PEP/pyruvate-binding domain-containing protein [Sedimentisphaerales bacterium]|nr:PEP/pyruvate-binding domain-containing protein [Sedimentisphaerales bacterium]
MGTAVVWLSKTPSISDGNSIGPKAVGLCTLHRLGARVPPGFIVTTAAFRNHQDTDGLGTRIESLLSKFDASPATTQSVLSEIRHLIFQSPWPEDLREQVAAAYERLDATAVAVRSSATAEDLPGHSFAGQYETILGVRSLEGCVEAIKRCWASLWTERAFEYRKRNGIDHRQVEMAVIVQRQIEPDAAGVAFTLDPVTGSRSRIVIESCRGLGEALVSGKVQPDRILLRKKDLSLIRQSVAADEPSLDLKSARRLGRAVRRIEQKLGSPQDIEWAIRDGVFWFLQARPITAIPQPKSWADRQAWSNANTGEVLPDVTTPVTWSMIESLFRPLFRSVLRLAGADADRATIAGLVAGRVYFNVNVGVAIGRPFGRTLGNTGRSDAAFGGGHMAMYHLGELDLPDEDLPDLGFRWPRYILSLPGIVYSLIRHSPRQGDRARARIRARNDELLAVDLAAMDTADLARLVTASLRENLGDLDLLYLVTSGPALLLFDLACRRWLGDQDLTLGFRLLAAYGGMADTEAGLDLWRLAELAHGDTQTEKLLLSGDSWEQVRERLRGTRHGRQFLVAWERFVAEHGHHCRGELEFFNARWSERPDYVLDMVRNYLRSIESVNPLENRRRLAAERDELTEQCRSRLKNPIKRAVFNWSLKRVRKLAADRENWKNEMVRQLAVLRRALLILGDRLHEGGVLSLAEDIFFLELAEIETLAQGRVEFDVAARIADRRAEYERNKACTPPPVVVGRFDPGKHALPQIDVAGELKGIAVSPGVATGKARVILRTDDHAHVEAGEILVAPFTDPAWTPYFLPAAGVVMDQGGILSHGAIIAREYGIPAVVNVGPLSRTIETGQLLRVDGDRGVVTLLDEK